MEINLNKINYLQIRTKLKWIKYCVLPAVGNDNANGNGNANSNIFNIKDTKLFVSVLTLSARNNQTLSKLLSKGLERSVYQFEYKTKSESRNMLFISVYSDQDVDSKRLKTRRYYLPKGIFDNYNVIINGKDFYDYPIDSDIKRYEEFKI